MVKQQKIPAGAVRIPVSGRRVKKLMYRGRPFLAKVLRMLSQDQLEAEPGSVKDNGGGAQAGGSSGAVTPGGFVHGEGSQEFLSTGRTGRRNAMPDILGEHAKTDVSGLPEKFEALTTDSTSTSGGVRSQAEPGPSHTG